MFICFNCHHQIATSWLSYVVKNSSLFRVIITQGDTLFQSYKAYLPTWGRWLIFSLKHLYQSIVDHMQDCSHVVHLSKRLQGILLPLAVKRCYSGVNESLVPHIVHLAQGVSERPIVRIGKFIDLQIKGPVIGNCKCTC